MSGGSRSAVVRCVVAVLLIASILGCTRTTKATAASPPPIVIVAEVVERTVPIVREYIGRTDAVPTVELRARVPGVLEEVLPDEGRAVTRGQTLFVIQREEYGAALQAAGAQLAKAESDLTRARDVSLVDRARAQPIVPPPPLQSRWHHEARGLMRTGHDGMNGGTT